ncbi:MAG: sigma-70 family RNA polymerase sigma factor [candidate division WS1 bacterium]|jgi:RNA polymerase sigma-70 factor (ECF subfamily)|nr:sigma-70 family RNA polymerase sigma factor [candidate division WS1 bacterium]
MAKARELSQSDVEALVERSKAGDRRAFGLLVDEYKDRIYNYVSRMLNDPHEAEDVTQEAFLRAYRSLPRFRGASSFHTWLYRIASNLAIDVVRKRKRSEPTYSLDEPLESEDGEYDREIPDSNLSPESRTSTRETRLAVRRAIMDLPEKLRDVMILYELQGETYEDIAEILDVPLGTVKSRLFNARNRLKGSLMELVQAGEIEVEQ